MAVLIDTNIAIHLRDGDPQVAARMDGLAEPPFISIVTLVELEGGVHSKPVLAAKRRAALDILLGGVVVLPFDDADARAYALIVSALGYSRPLILDRMIAATALVHDLLLITMNGADFRDVPELKLEVWELPRKS